MRSALVCLLLLQPVRPVLAGIVSVRAHAGPLPATAAHPYTGGPLATVRPLEFSGSLALSPSLSSPLLAPAAAVTAVTGAAAEEWAAVTVAPAAAFGSAATSILSPRTAAVWVAPVFAAPTAEEAASASAGRAALLAMRGALSRDEKGGAAEVSAWFDGVSARLESGGTLSVLEHSAMQLALRQGRLRGRERAALDALSGSRRLLTGREATSADALRRLPRSVLAAADRDGLQLHQAMFHDGPVRAWGALKTAAADYIPRPSHAFVAAAALALLLSGAAGGAALGAAGGYAFGSLVEYGIHRFIGHASPAALRRLERFPRLHAWVSEQALSHALVHHGAFGANYVEAYAPRDLSAPGAAQRREAKRLQIQDIVDSRGADVARRVAAREDGVKIDRPLRAAFVTAPLMLAAAYLAGLGASAALGVSPGLMYYAAFLAASLLFVPASNNLHPYLHMTRAGALERAGPFMRWFLGTAYVAWVARSHYAHHDRAGKPNQNLVAGADFLFGFQPATVAQLLALKLDFDAIH
jgi:hypothetical protein